MVKTTARNRTDDIPSSSSIVGQILSFIYQRRYEPNERLPSERDFAERFGTSRAAVREALAALESMRVIERRPNSGIFLRNSDESSIEALVLHAASGLPFYPEEAANVFQVRRILEVQAVKLACENRTSEDIDNLRNILRVTKNLLDRNKSIQKEDEDFHMAIVAATKNGILVRIVKSFYELSKERRKVYFSDHERSKRAYEDHTGILEAIEARRASDAGKRMTQHLSQALATWQVLLSETIPPRV
jgi:DNA-binding FadR family transcriptional regulator